jgi:hypothetical protein
MVQIIVWLLSLIPTLSHDIQKAGQIAFGRGTGNQRVASGFSREIFCDAVCDISLAGLPSVTHRNAEIQSL